MDYKICFTRRRRDEKYERRKEVVAHQMFIEKVLCACLIIATLSGINTVRAQQSPRGLTAADVLRVADVSDARISPDGEWVVYVVSVTEGEGRRGSLWMARAARSLQLSPMVGLSVPAPVQLNTGGVSASNPRWSPDGRRIAFAGAREGQSGIWVMSPPSSILAERQMRLVATVRETNFHIAYAGERFAWSPDGRRIAYISATDEDAATDFGAPPITSATTTTATTARGDDPRVIDRIQYKSRASFSDRLRTHIWVAEVDDAAAPPRQLTSGMFYDHAVAWHPRGDEVAFLSNRETDPDAVNNSDIYAVALDGRTRRITETRGSEYEPAWSPDGRWIAHTATTRDVTTIDSISEDTHVWIVEASSGGSRRELATGLNRRARAPRWSPDSGAVFFLAGDRGRTLIFRAGIDGSPARPLFDRFTPGTLDEESDPHDLPSRPYQISSFSLNARGVPAFAFTLGDTLHPAEVWIGDAAGKVARRATGHNDSLLRSVALVEPEDISFRSFDGTMVQGWLIKPLGMRATDSRRQPLILSIHGGPHGMYGYGFNPAFQAYAARGYGVLYLNPRGSSGYGQKFSDGTFREWGGGDYRDLMTGVDEVVRTRSWIDENRLGVTGGSYGGFMTNWIITQTPRFRAAVAVASVSNLVSFYGTSLYQDLIHAEFGGFPWDDYELLWRWSPLRYVRAVETPTMFIHGELDNDVHITQAEEMYTALRRRGVEAVFIRYPREGHSLREPRHRQDATERTLAWFDKHLKF